MYYNFHKVNKVQMHIEKKYVCEHNNGFINEHKNKFYLKRGKRIENFIFQICY